MNQPPCRSVIAGISWVGTHLRRFVRTLIPSPHKELPYLLRYDGGEVKFEETEYHAQFNQDSGVVVSSMYKYPGVQILIRKRVKRSTSPLQCLDKKRYGSRLQVRFLLRCVAIICRRVLCSTCMGPRNHFELTNTLQGFFNVPPDKKQSLKDLVKEIQYVYPVNNVDSITHKDFIQAKHG
jgi:hypothetical protein